MNRTSNAFTEACRKHAEGLVFSTLRDHANAEPCFKAAQEMGKYENDIVGLAHAHFTFGYMANERENRQESLDFYQLPANNIDFMHDDPTKFLKANYNIINAADALKKKDILLSRVGLLNKYQEFLQNEDPRAWTDAYCVLSSTLCDIDKAPSVILATSKILLSTPLEFANSRYRQAQMLASQDRMPEAADAFNKGEIALNTWLSEFPDLCKRGYTFNYDDNMLAKSKNVEELFRKNSDFINRGGIEVYNPRSRVYQTPGSLDGVSRKSFTTTMEEDDRTCVLNEYTGDPHKPGLQYRFLSPGRKIKDIDSSLGDGRTLYIVQESDGMALLKQQPRLRTSTVRQKSPSPER